VTKQEARDIIAKFQSHAISQHLIACFKKPYDNGIEATVGAVLVGRSEHEFMKKKETLDNRIKNKFPDIKIQYAKPSIYKGRLESFISFYIKYAELHDLDKRNKPVKKQGLETIFKLNEAR
jgi:hypothetical protein